jgi:oligopeptide transport system ATP-binding protein
VAVLYLGKLAEVAGCEQLFARPFHPYTEALLSAVPVPDPVLAETRERIMLPGDPPSPTNPPSGCRFHTRCAFATDLCTTDEPTMLRYPDGRLVACHHPRNATPDEIAAATAPSPPTSEQP